MALRFLLLPWPKAARHTLTPLAAAGYRTTKALLPRPVRLRKECDFLALALGPDPPASNVQVSHLVPHERSPPMGRHALPANDYLMGLVVLALIAILAVVASLAAV
jgi:hypothetical protein